MIVFEFIFELIMEYFIFQLIRGLGLVGLKNITFSDLSFAILGIIIFLLIQVI